MDEYEEASPLDAAKGIIYGVALGLFVLWLLYEWIGK